MKRQNRGLTLIELLVIVLIIATLVLVALPHFISASTRAEVARVQQDMQGIESALEWYFLDYKKYPESSGSDLLINRSESNRGLQRLVDQKYMDAVPEDRFSDINFKYNGSQVYQFGSSKRVKSQNGLGLRIPAWILVSPGPDNETDSQDVENFPFGTVVWQYDPVNGLRSDGDIVSKGGDWQLGDWYLDGTRIKASE